jgi:hypothetical protein
LVICIAKNSYAKEYVDKKKQSNKKSQQVESLSMEKCIGRDGEYK